MEFFTWMSLKATKLMPDISSLENSHQNLARLVANWKMTTSGIAAGVWRWIVVKWLYMINVPSMYEMTLI